ncbi:unnamed protein product [Pedinophyceae sp. YPF-701]|nr:unnamed protein product [Pedinophyceae sp. YPF-701]
MGSGRDKRKKKNPKAPGQGAAKTAEKTAKNQGKKSRRAAQRLEGDEDDIDALLEQFKLADARNKTAVIEKDVPPPSPRVNASFVAYETQRSKEVVLYGGEHMDSNDKARVYGDLYRYDVARNTWSRLRIPGGPKPRSAHQAVVHRHYMWVFGGELTSPNMEKFHHFRDLWRLDLQSNVWEEMKIKGGPSARSGHRMAVWRGHLVLFGGFYDTGAELRYYNDLWLFDTEHMEWQQVASDAGAGPSPRSACQLCVYGQKLFLYGGYTRKADEDDPEIERAKVHADMWCFDFSAMRWEKIKRAGMAPGPRASFAMVPHKKRAVLFGGVSDQDAGREGELIVSEFYNEAYSFAFETQRWFPLQIRAKKTQGAQGDGGTEEGVAAAPVPAGATVVQHEGDVAFKAARRIQAHFRGYITRKAYVAYRVGGVVSELLYSPASYGVDPGSRNTPKPRARINAAMAVIGNDLWLYGGAHGTTKRAKRHAAGKHARSVCDLRSAARRRRDRGGGPQGHGA